MWRRLFELRGSLTTRENTLLTLLGLAFFVGIWIVLTAGENPIMPRGSLPSPIRVLKAYPDLIVENELVKNTFRSYGLNLAGYIKAILYALPLGFLIGLFPFFRGAFQRLVDAIRFVPLTALTVIFIVWFGIYTEAKVNFLAFGIFIFLLPVVVQRITEVENVYVTTVYTLGANKWQTIKSVFFPAVISKLIDDIRILTAISWTYIIVAENTGDQGGLGSLIYRTGQRMGRIDKTFAILILIIVIGILQDKIFAIIDKKLFPHKYQLHDSLKKSKVKDQKISQAIYDYILGISGWILLGIYVALVINEFIPFLSALPILTYLFGDTVWAIHIVFGCIFLFLLKIWKENKEIAAWSVKNYSKN
mgnify:CR=1 FL=1